MNSGGTQAKNPKVSRAVGVGAGLALALGLTAMPLVAGAATASSRLAPGSQLASGSTLYSPNSSYRLAMQADGNLVEYSGSKAIFETKTARHRGAYLAMQRNGDLVMYDAKKPIWSSGSAGHAGAYLVVENTGAVDLYAKNGRTILWTSRKPLPVLSYGARGPAVSALQHRLGKLHYWVGRPDGYFGDATQQALFALEKVAGISRTGTLDRATRKALVRGAEPKPRRASGNLVEVNLHKDLVMILRHGQLLWTFNTSTGGGYTYTSGGVTSVAVTPRGVFHVYREINGADTDSLGTLWRPKFFTGGYAIHGDSYVPAYPVSHGCVRVSDEAINYIWSHDLIPMGIEVWVF